MPELKIAGTGSSSFNEAGITPPPYSLRTSLFGVNAAELHGWRPDVEVRRDKDKLLVRAVLPGLRMEDVKVTVTGDLLEIENGTLQANRNFYRAIPMPEAQHPAGGRELRKWRTRHRHPGHRADHRDDRYTNPPVTQTERGVSRVWPAYRSVCNFPANRL